jgi:hypothetical protein
MTMEQESKWREFEALLEELCEDTLEAEDVERLNEFLDSGDEYRRRYLEYMELHAALWSGSGRQHLPLPRLSSPRTLTRFRLVHGLAAAVLVMGVVFAYTAYNNALRDAQQQNVAVNPSLALIDDGVAVLTQTVAVEWDQGKQFKIGDTIPPGVLRLKSGVAQLEFYSGATMVLEGPAELKLASAEKCFVHNGKVRVLVPDVAQGFTVISPQAELVDLGTEFAMEVTPLVETQVHVFDGKVELYPPDSQKSAGDRTELLAGDGVHLRRSGDPLAIAANEEAFVSLTAMERLVKRETRQRRSSWEQHAQEIRQDSHVAVFYPFEQPKGIDRTLQAYSPLESSLDGAIVGCSWSEGRWPGKDALEFKRPGDRVRIYVPGEYEALTLAAWVRVDGLDLAFSALMLTDGYDMGEIHWQIKKSGQLRFGVRNTANYNETHAYDSSVIWDLKQLGQWTHVATVVDNRAGYVAHYANGREISREPMANPIKFRIGSAEIGNWKGPTLDNGTALPNVRQSIRNFNGRIDEFIIMDQALSAKEIKELYHAGKPVEVQNSVAS